MARITAVRTIDAPVEKVFAVVGDVEQFKKAIPHIVKVEFLSETRKGVGTKFKETRRMGKREAAAVLEVTEWVRNDRIRLVSDMHGTVWDSVFTVKPAGGGTELTLVMDANAKNFFAKMMNALIMGMIRKALEKDMDAVKAHCEGGGPGA